MLTENSYTTPAISFEEFQAIAPDAVKGLVAAGKSVDNFGLDKKLTELIKIRVSQISGCAYCLQLHLNIAQRLGVEKTKIDLLPAWRDAGVFSTIELAALEWAEQLTRRDEKAPMPVPASALTAAFSHEEIVHLTVTIATINAWNRIAGPLRFPPPFA